MLRVGSGKNVLEVNKDLIKFLPEEKQKLRERIRV